jgi:hypothetical protein
MINDSCPLCKSKSILRLTNTEYVECRTCSLQFPLHSPTSGVVTNQFPKSPTGSGTRLAVRQAKLALKIAPNGSFIDLGCGSGEYLYALKRRSPNVQSIIGVERDELSQTAARNAGLMILSDMPNEVHNSLISMWHSAEHFSPQLLQTLLRQLNSSGNSLLIAVPNGDSRAWIKYRESFAFFDPKSHLVQYTPTSLEKMLMDSGWVIEKFYYSFFYGLFNAIQTTLNLTRSRNELYNLVKREGKRPSLQLVLKSLTSLFFKSPHLVMLLLAETNKKRGSTLLISARPR